MSSDIIIMDNKEKNPHAGHRERLRGRFLASGLEGFSDHEVLELLLCYAIPRRDVNDMAHVSLSASAALRECWMRLPVS